MSRFLILPRRAWLPTAEIYVGVALLAAASLSIVLTRIPGGIALFWPGSAIAATLLIRLERVRPVAAGVAVMGALLLSNVLVAHRPWAVASAFAAINTLETALMVVAFRSLWRFPYPDISIGQAAIMTAVLGITIPAMTAAVGGLLLHQQFGMRWGVGTLQWWSSHTIGACLLGPVISLFSVTKVKRLLSPAFIAQNALILAGCLVGCYLAIRYVRFPFVIIGLLLLVAAFRVGGFGASLMGVSVGLLITNLWAFGIRPLGLDAGLSSEGTLIGLPVIALLATVMSPIAVGLGTDARRAAAKALRLSERNFRESMAHSPIGMLIADLDGTWRFTNLALQRMLGYTAEEFQAMPPGGPSKTDDWKESESRRRGLFSGENTFYQIARAFRHRDGRWVWTNVAVSLLRDEMGAPFQLIAQIESLEARQQAEATLAAERERLRITLCSINDAVITTDAATRITYLNPAAEALLVADLAVVSGWRIDEVMHLLDPTTSKTAANLVGQCAFHGKVFKRDKPCVLHRADGGVSYITDTVSPVMSEEGVLSALVVVLKDSTAEVARGQDLEHRAYHDSLTGLSNRADFNERLQDVFRRSTATECPSAVIAIDLDRFKAVNDTAGHAAGDAVLCKVAEQCRGLVRGSDIVARLGGDEFAVILEKCSHERATQIAEQILKALNPVTLNWGNATYLVNASLGLAMTSSAMPDEKDWLGAADRACYVAKHQGRGRLQVAPCLPLTTSTGSSG